MAGENEAAQEPGLDPPELSRKARRSEPALLAASFTASACVLRQLQFVEEADPVRRAA